MATLVITALMCIILGALIGAAGIVYWLIRSLIKHL